MLDDAFAQFERKVQAGEFEVAVLELLHDTQGVEIVVETAAVHAHEFVEFTFASVTERWVADVVNESQGFGEFAVEAERRRNRASDLSDFERVRQAVPEVIGIARSEDLRFRFEAAKRARVDDAVAVARIFGAIRVASLGKAAATRKFFAHGQGREWRGVRDNPLRFVLVTETD